MAGENANFGKGYTGRVDAFNTGGQAGFEIHVYDAAGTEVGVAGPEGWIAKHGFSGEAPNLPIEVVEKLSGRVIQELRARGLLAAKGILDISEFINRFLSADALVCILTDSCDRLYKAIDCALHPDKPGCSCNGA